jgi:quinohemoprotein ethanol dehydrogenase
LTAAGLLDTGAIDMRHFFAALGLTFAAFSAMAGDAPAFTSAQLSKDPVNDWVTNGGSLFNQRYSPLNQINTGNVSQLKADWRTHLNGSGMGPPYSGEAQPIVYDGVIYLPTGADDVFALDVQSGKQLWMYRSGLDQAVSTVCCGWTSRGVAIGEGRVFLGRLDGELVALDQHTGKEVWSVKADRWEDGFTITSAPLYYDGMVITGVAGGEFAARGRVRAFSAKDGKLLWTFYTVPAPGEPGHDSWPQEGDAWEHGGATVWQTPAVDPKLGLLYFSTGNPGPDFNGSQRKGDNLFSVSVVALEAKTGKYRWHFQQVHHDLWDYDSPSPVVLFDIDLNGKHRQAIAEIGKTGWVYILDRVTGKPLIGIDEKAVPQDARQQTAATQPFPVGDPVVAHEIDIPPAGFRLVNDGRIFTPYWDSAVVAKPSPLGGTNWPPSSLDPRQGYLFVCSNDGMGRFLVSQVRDPKSGSVNLGGVFGFSDIPMTGIFGAVDMHTNKIVWRQRWKDTCYSGSTATAGDLVFTGRNDGRFVALDSRNGDVLWEYQTGAGVNATASVFEYQGHEKVVIYSAGNMFGGTPAGDSVFLFSLDGTLGPQDPPAPVAAMPLTVSVKEADTRNGAQIFTHLCVACHGEEGKGGHGGGPDITGITSPDLVAATVTYGKNNMPPLSISLSPNEIRDVAVFVTSELGKTSVKH